MAEAKQRDAWNHTSQVLAMLYNCNRNPKRDRALKPADFHPFPKRRPQPSKRVSGKGLRILRDVFVKKGKKGPKQRERLRRQMQERKE